MYPRVSDETDHPPSSFIEYLTVPNAIIKEYTQQSKKIKKKQPNSIWTTTKTRFCVARHMVFSILKRNQDHPQATLFFLEKFEYYAQRQNVGKQDRKINTIHRQNERGKKNLRREEWRDDLNYREIGRSRIRTKNHVILFILFFIFSFVLIWCPCRQE